MAERAITDADIERMTRGFEPDAFESQQIEVIDWEINGDLVLLHATIRSRGAGSGLEVEIDGWFVWTVVDHVVTRIRTFTDETDARAAVRMDPR